MFEETERVELKEIYIPEIKKEVIAFANTYGGIVYIGVTDDGQVVGVANTDETLLQLTNALRDSIRPDVTMFTQTELLYHGEKAIIKLTVCEGTRKPYYLGDKGLKPSGVYVRQGASSAPASEDAIRNMIKLSDGDSFENHRSLEQALSFDTLATEMQTRNIEFGEVQKQNLGIVTSDGLYTNLGLLVSNQCKHSIKVAIFQGTDKSIFRDRHEFGGSVFQQLTDAYQCVDFYNATKATFEGLLRVDSRDYPVDAIREALLNAIIHRDYSFSGSIAINIYSDKLEIISLGGLVSGLSIDAIMMGASQPRNEKLAALFYRMKLIESYGIGIGKMMSAYGAYPIKPSFDTVQGAFRVTLPNVNATTMTTRESHQQVMDYLATHDAISRAQVEVLLNVKMTRANAIIKEMLELGYIKKSGEGKNTVYCTC
ncbi:putative DNA binding domain-containing protein [Bengtsoniella intestinalis]|uniref:RNA-binding domain-containing protein n=1 Tax=Bengtsoniella intestinalis TaxID=3073143 RepID=UPI00391F3EAC